MNKYELLYIIDKDVAEDKREECFKMVEDTITEQGGTVSNVDKWGMKKFAYPINYKNEGYYCLIAFECAATALTELEHRMRISDAFVRFMITNVIENKKTEKAKTAKKPERREPERRERAERPVKEVVEEVKAEEVVEAKVEEPAAEKTEG